MMAQSRPTTSTVMVGFGPTIHEFRGARFGLLQANSWMVVPSTTMTKENVAGSEHWHLRRRA
jgi:hypothetical protein